jgi:D-alanyl-D-alanine carboxypeptidase (penicillin-binding protein 5/6)
LRDNPRSESRENTMSSLRSTGLCMITCLSTLALAATAEAQITTPASHAILMDYETGEILFCKECDQKMPPSSMSKLMTVEPVFARLKDGRLKLTDTFHVSEFAWREQYRHPGASLTWLSINSDATIDTLLKGIIVQSGGDACIVVAEGIAGSEEEFAKLANQRAKELGLTNSNFVNSTGMPDPNHYMSAHDIAKLSAHVIRDYPEYYYYFAIPEFSWNNINQPNRNRLLFMNIGADGLKTGHTEAAKYGIVGSAQREGRRLITVINGMPSEAARNAEAARLLNIGFREFRSYELFAANAPVSEAPVFGGSAAKVGLTVAEPLRVLMPADARQNMKVTVRYNGPVVAPIAAGQEIGTVTVTVPGKPDRNVPLVAAAEVPSANIFGKMWIGMRSLIMGADS